MLSPCVARRERFVLTHIRKSRVSGIRKTRPFPVINRVVPDRTGGKTVLVECGPSDELSFPNVIWMSVQRRNAGSQMSGDTIGWLSVCAGCRHGALSNISFKFNL